MFNEDERALIKGGRNRVVSGLELVVEAVRGEGAGTGKG